MRSYSNYEQSPDAEGERTEMFTSISAIQTSVVNKSEAHSED